MKYLLVLALFACRSSSAPEAPAAPATPAAPVPVERVVSTEPSIYDLGLTLRDSHDQRVGLDVSRGAPVVMTMFYGSCAVACPALIGEVKRIVAESGRDDVRVLLVSFDPARDTPARLAELATAHQLDARFTIASTADEPDARELAAAIGYKFRVLASGEFFHSSTILVLDEDGRPLARTEGFNQRATLLAALR